MCGTPRKNIISFITQFMKDMTNITNGINRTKNTDVDLMNQGRRLQKKAKEDILQREKKRIQQKGSLSAQTANKGVNVSSKTAKLLQHKEDINAINDMRTISDELQDDLSQLYEKRRRNKKAGNTLLFQQGVGVAGDIGNLISSKITSKRSSEESNLFKK